MRRKVIEGKSVGDGVGGHGGDGGEGEERGRTIMERGKTNSLMLRFGRVKKDG